ncbi:MAG: hypothetical protein R2713_04285 [Ilumatobacteraceae bacterium]
MFVNLEVVRCATDTLHTEFETLIGRPGGDPEDVLAGVDEQLGWMRDAGLADVDCQWRWRGFAVLTGRGVGGWRNTKQLHRLEPPVAVELLVFEVRTDAFAAWQMAEHEHWTLALADRFPAMLDKQTWVQDLGEWQRVSVVIGWRSVEEWQAIDTGWLDEQEARLVAAVGADASGWCTPVTRVGCTVPHERVPLTGAGGSGRPATGRRRHRQTMSVGCSGSPSATRPASCAVRSQSKITWPFSTSDRAGSVGTALGEVHAGARPRRSCRRSNVPTDRRRGCQPECHAPLDAHRVAACCGVELGDRGVPVEVAPQRDHSSPPRVERGGRLSTARSPSE